MRSLFTSTLSRRGTKIIQGLTALGFALGMVCLQPTRPALAFPPLPSSFYGTVKINASNVPDGTLVKALINGHAFAESLTQTYQGNSVYSLDIPGDDTTTPGTIEGGVENDTIVFSIGGVQADQRGSWKSGTNINMDLTASTSATLIPPQATLTSVPTQTAIIVVTPASATPTTQAKVTSTPMQTPTIVVKSPTSTQTTLPQGSPTSTMTTQSHATPTNIVRTQTSPRPTARLQAARAIPTKTNPENASANSSLNIVIFVILFIVCILMFIYWSVKVRDPKEK